MLPPYYDALWNDIVREFIISKTPEELKLWVRENMSPQDYWEYVVILGSTRTETKLANYMQASQD
jgi:hypothetical protein